MTIQNGLNGGGKKRRSYDFILLKRLIRYAAPYNKTMILALFLTIIITLLNLAFPYFAKIAVDRYILSSWYIVDTVNSHVNETEKFIENYGHLLEETSDRRFFIVSHTGLKKIEPDKLSYYQSLGIIKTERNYRADPKVKSDTLSGFSEIGFHKTNDGSTLIPYKIMLKMPEEKIVEIRSGDILGVSLIGAILISTLFLWFLLGYGEYYLLESVGQRIMQDIRLELFNRIQSQCISFFDKNPVGRLLTRVTNDIQNLNEMFKSVIITVFKDLFLILGILVALLYLDIPLAFVCIGLIPLVFALTLIFSTLARQAFREIRSAIAMLNSFLQERITGMHIIQLFAGQNHQMSAFSKINHKNYMAGMKQVRIFSLFMPLMDLGASFAVALIIWYGGTRVIQEQLTLGTLIAFVSYIRMFFKPIRDMSEKFGIMQSAMASTERIFESMDKKEEIREAENARTPSEIKGKLQFDNVSFSYDKGRPVLKDISFIIEPGETVAIVGATGSGKTTIINLTERFYDPDAGAILLDGLDLRQWPKEELRKTISLVMQDVFLFAGNLSENISLGRRQVDSFAIKKAASQANADLFIKNLPDGYNEEIGEGGYTLSTGQRQLLSFSRALAVDTRILILDEATSSVDPETERLIQNAISRLSVSKTTLIVAHRLSTIRNADRILVMHHGRLVEQGNHDDLMKQKGIYYKLNRLRED
ncbi:ABC transporter ATP-binding protein [Thermodesulfobacteriota bacterium]